MPDTGTTGRFIPGVPTGVPLRGRYIDLHRTGTGTYDLYGIACGYDYCDTEKRYMARYVDLYFDEMDEILYQVWATASECCQYPTSLNMQFVLDEIFFPLGISADLKIILKAAGAKCWPIDCVEGSMTWDGDSWNGTVGGIAMEMRFDPTNPPDAPFDFEFLGGCITPQITQPIVHCLFPLKIYMAFGASSPCCECVDVDNVVEIFVLGYCKRRYAGRYVDLLETGTGQSEVWAVSDCCEPCAETVFPCCDFLEICPIQASFTLLSDDFTGTPDFCPCLDGETVTMDPNTGGHDWSKSGITSDCGSITFSISLDCENVEIDGVSCCRLTFRMSGGGTNCTCPQVEITLEDLCDVTPFEAEFDLTLTCNDVGLGGNTCCRTFTYRITLTT